MNYAELRQQIIALLGSYNPSQEGGVTPPGPTGSTGGVQPPPGGVEVPTTPTSPTGQPTQGGTVTPPRRR